jgi:hypothetical protein
MVGLPAYGWMIRMIGMTIRAIQKMPGFELEFKERDEQFWVVLKFPKKSKDSG